MKSPFHIVSHHFTIFHQSSSDFFLALPYPLLIPFQLFLATLQVEGSLTWNAAAVSGTFLDKNHGFSSYGV